MHDLQVRGTHQPHIQLTHSVFRSTRKMESSARVVDVEWPSSFFRAKPEGLASVLPLLTSIFPPGAPCPCPSLVGYLENHKHGSSEHTEEHASLTSMTGKPAPGRFLVPADKLVSAIVFPMLRAWVRTQIYGVAPTFWQRRLSLSELVDHTKPGRRVLWLDLELLSTRGFVGMQQGRVPIGGVCSPGFRDMVSAGVARGLQTIRGWRPDAATFAASTMVWLSASAHVVAGTSLRVPKTSYTVVFPLVTVADRQGHGELIGQLRHFLDLVCGKVCIFDPKTDAESMLGVGTAFVDASATVGNRLPFADKASRIISHACAMHGTAGQRGTAMAGMGARCSCSYRLAGRPNVPVGLTVPWTPSAAAGGTTSKPGQYQCDPEASDVCKEKGLQAKFVPSSVFHALDWGDAVRVDALLRCACIQTSGVGALMDLCGGLDVWSRAPVFLDEHTESGWTTLAEDRTKLPMHTCAPVLPGMYRGLCPGDVARWQEAWPENIYAAAGAFSGVAGSDSGGGCRDGSTSPGALGPSSCGSGMRILLDRQQLDELARLLADAVEGGGLCIPAAKRHKPAPVDKQAMHAPKPAMGTARDDPVRVLVEDVRVGSAQDGTTCVRFYAKGLPCAYRSPPGPHSSNRMRITWYASPDATMPGTLVVGCTSDECKKKAESRAVSIGKRCGWPCVRSIEIATFMHALLDRAALIA